VLAKLSGDPQFDVRNFGCGQRSLVSNYFAWPQSDVNNHKLLGTKVAPYKEITQQGETRPGRHFTGLRLGDFL